MILDEALFATRRGSLAPSPGRKSAWRRISDLGREIAQRYAAHREDWDVEQIEHWYTICTALLALLSGGTLEKGTLSTVWSAWRSLDIGLPDWIEILGMIKRRTIDTFKSHRGGGSRKVEKLLGIGHALAIR
jgi:hypothetical protein